MEIGEFTGEGFAIGIDSMLSDIQKASENMAEASIPTLPKVDQIPNKSINHEGTGSNGQSQINHFNFERMFEGSQFIIREEADIKKLAKLLNDYIKMGARKGGVIIG